MFKEKRNDDYIEKSSVENSEMKEVALEFTENFLSFIEGENADPIIANARDAETKIYINLLQLFEDVAEIIKRQVETDEINEENNEVRLTIELDYVSEENKKKEKKISYTLFLKKNEFGGYDIISAV